MSQNLRTNTQILKTAYYHKQIKIFNAKVCQRITTISQEPVKQVEHS